MGNYLTKGTTFVDGGPCNAALLNAHVDESILKPTAISSQTLKDPAALSDEILINDGGTFKKITAQQLHNLILYPGCVVQSAYAEYTANTNLTAVIPADDTIPENTEGTEILSVSITPRFSTSIILAEFTAQFAGSTNQDCIAALFRDAIVGAICAQVISSGGLNFSQAFSFAFIDSPSTASAITYKMRVGPSTGTMRMNGWSTVRLLGGSSRAALVLKEIKV